jgi:hypothetical protein
MGLSGRLLLSQYRRQAQLANLFSPTFFLTRGRPGATILWPQHMKTKSWHIHNAPAPRRKSLMLLWVKYSITCSQKHSLLIPPLKPYNNRKYKYLVAGKAIASSSYPPSHSLCPVSCLFFLSSQSLSVLVLCLLHTNYYELSCLKQHQFIISQFLLFMCLGTAELSSLLGGSHGRGQGVNWSAYFSGPHSSLSSSHACSRIWFSWEWSLHFLVSRQQGAFF